MTSPGRVWLLACALLAAAALLSGQLQLHTVDWQPGLAAQQPWRWWSAALVHWDRMHLLLNLAGLVIVAAWGFSARAPMQAVMAWAASWPFTHLALLAQPDLLHYAGLSGLLHAGVAVVATWVLGTAAGNSRAQHIAGFVLVGLMGKLLYEEPWNLADPAGLEQGYLTTSWPFAVASLAHVSGAAAGVLFTMLALARENKRMRRL